MPGGLIPNNSNVLVDYVYQQPGSYDLDYDAMRFGINLNLFDNAFELYYKYSFREYEDLVDIPNLSLDYYNRNVYGSRIDFDLLSAGVEYDNYAANLVPYKLLSYYLTVQGRFRNKVKYNLTMQRNDYLEYGPEKQTQRFDIINANIFYLFNYDSNLNLSMVYRGQEIAENESQWMTARLEYMTKIKKLLLRTNINYHARNINQVKSYSFGANIILTRSF